MESVDAHNVVIDDLQQQIEDANNVQDALIDSLFESFQVDDQTREQFEDFLLEEFNELNDAGILPNGNVDLSDRVEIPMVPVGFDGVVEDLRDQIDTELDTLGNLLDFNAFAFAFVCEESCDEIQVLIDASFEEFTAAKTDLDKVLDDLLVIEGEEGDTRMSFETKLREEFEASTADTDSEDDRIELPFDSLPEGCDAGQAKLDQLRGVLLDIADIVDMTDFLKPRIDDAASILLTCQASKEELENIVVQEFSQWTDCINEKSAILTAMYPTQAEEGEGFKDFLNRIRAEYDQLKDDGTIQVISPELEIPAVLDQCPEDVHDQLSVAQQFEGILEDCLTYHEWLKAHQTGMCDRESFEDIITDNTPALMADMDHIDDLLDALQTIQPENNQTPEDFAASMRAEFDADEDAEPVSAGIVVPETSMMCSVDVLDAEQAAQDFVVQADDKKAYIAFLEEILGGKCGEVQKDYDGIRVLAEPHLRNIEEQRDVILHALWFFKKTAADDVAGTPEETLEVFTVRYRGVYDDTDPLVIPIMSLDTFIDVPDLCEPGAVDAANALLVVAEGINDNTAYLAWLNARLAECDDAAEMSIDAQIEMLQPTVTMANQDKQRQLDDLFSFAANEGETMEEFTARRKAEFDAYLESTGAELVDTGVVIPDLPELADDETFEAREELIALEQELAYCLTLTDWLSDQVSMPCAELLETFEAQIVQEDPRIPECGEKALDLILTLKELKDPDNLMENAEFSAMMLDMFAELTDYPVVSSEIEVLPVPLVCPDETKDGQARLMTLISDLEDCLTTESWLWDQAQECCQDLGLEYREQNEDKEEDLEVAHIRNTFLIANVNTMDGREMSDLVDAMETATVTPYVDDTVITDAPAECQQSVADARQILLDTCDEFIEAKTFQNFLEDEVARVCLDQTVKIDNLVAEQTPVLGSLNEEKSAMYVTWAAIDANDGESAEDFEARMLERFRMLIENGDIEMSSSGVELFPVTDMCAQIAHDKLNYAIALVEQLDR